MEIKHKHLIFLGDGVVIRTNHPELFPQKGNTVVFKDPNALIDFKSKYELIERGVKSITLRKYKRWYQKRHGNKPKI